MRSEYRFLNYHKSIKKCYDVETSLRCGGGSDVSASALTSQWEVWQTGAGTVAPLDAGASKTRRDTGAGSGAKGAASCACVYWGVCEPLFKDTVCHSIWGATNTCVNLSVIARCTARVTYRLCNAQETPSCVTTYSLKWKLGPGKTYERWLKRVAVISCYDYWRLWILVGTALAVLKFAARIQ